MVEDTTDLAAYLRGRLHLARIDHDSPLGVALDVLMTVVVDVPAEALEKWRTRFDQAVRGSSGRGQRPTRDLPPDRDTWGLLPSHQAQMKQLSRTASGVG